MTEIVSKTSRGTIVYDSDIFDQASEDLFRPAAWESATPVTGALRSAGRGNTVILGDGKQEFVLRRYMRGGLIGRVIKDTYFFTGENQTRSLNEWRLLRKLVSMGLNVPRPAAACYHRRAMFYTADLLTIRVPGIRSLAQRLLDASGSTDFWQSLGSGICRFHNAGVFHADMNAYNVQLDENDVLWLLDFDRGRLLPAGTWKQKTLARLHRSLQKIRQLEPGVYFKDSDWEQFLQGYFSESRSS